MQQCGCVVDVDAAMMLVQCFYGDGSNAGKLLVVMWLRRIDIDATMLSALPSQGLCKP